MTVIGGGGGESLRGYKVAVVKTRHGATEVDRDLLLLPEEYDQKPPDEVAQQYL